jgi:hypothetical protein
MTTLRACGSLGFQQLFGLGALLCGLSACQFTQTTTTTARIAGPEVTRVRLAQPHSVPLSGAWRQEGRSIVGRVAFTTECRAERTQSVERREVTETRTNTPSMKAWTIAGGVIGVMGIGFLMASTGKDESVHCGSGGAPEDGDTCTSEAGAYRTLGLTGAAFGITTAVVGAIMIARKPQVETKPLGTDQVMTTASTMQACGIPGSLEGMTLAVSWPGVGPVTGRVARDGTARIELAPEAPLPDSAVRVIVASVPGSAPDIVAPGAAVGEVRLVSETVASGKRARAAPATR